MDIKKFLPYIGAFLAAVLAVAALVTALSGHSDTPESWDALTSSVKQVGTAADLTATTAVTNKDEKVCIVAKTVSGLAGGVADSVGAVKLGTCRIPDVSVDVSACLTPAAVTVTAEAPVAADATATPAPETTEAAPVAVATTLPAPEAAPAADATAPATETTEAAPVATVSADTAALVDSTVSPLVVLIQGVVSKSDATPTSKAWATGVLAWIDSGRPSIVALVENPAEGKLSFKGVDIEGCTP